jgi:hypothetical protein
VERDGDHDQGTRPDGDGPGDDVRQEDVGHGTAGRSVSLGERRNRATAAVRHEDSGFASDHRRSRRHRPVAPVEQTSDDEPGDRGELAEEDQGMNTLDREQRRAMRPR